MNIEFGWRRNSWAGLSLIGCGCVGGAQRRTLIGQDLGDRQELLNQVKWSRHETWMKCVVYVTPVFSNGPQKRLLSVIFVRFPLILDNINIKLRIIREMFLNVKIFLLLYSLKCFDLIRVGLCWQCLWWWSYDNDWNWSFSWVLYLSLMFIHLRLGSGCYGNSV